MNSEMTIAEEMCEELSAEIGRMRIAAASDCNKLKDQIHRLSRVNEDLNALVESMCAGKMHPQCPGCKRLRLLVKLWAGAAIIGAICMAVVCAAAVALVSFK